MSTVYSVMTPSSGRGEGEPADPPRADGIAHGSTPDEAVRDSLHILALDVLPLETKALLGARMVKSARLSCLVDLGAEVDSGGPVVPLNVVQEALGGRTEALARDLEMLANVARIASYDVYSLRIELRSLGVDEAVRLRLSPRKRRELAGRMQGFARPLMERVFGDGAGDVGDMETLTASIDRATVVENLRTLGDRIGLPLSKVPDFLDDYADIFTSVAYFSSCHDGVRRTLGDFSAWMGELEAMGTLKGDPQAARTVGDIRQSLVELTMHLEACFASLDRLAHRFWDTLEAERFEDAFQMIEAHHTALGAILCGLAVKATAWQQAWPSGGGAPDQRIDWLRREMAPGLSALCDTATLAMLTITRQVG